MAWSLPLSRIFVMGPSASGPSSLIPVRCFMAALYFSSASSMSLFHALPIGPLCPHHCPPPPLFPMTFVLHIGHLAVRYVPPDILALFRISSRHARWYTPRPQ